jgi:hypothetical protein
MNNSTPHADKRDIPRLPIVKALAIIASIPRWLILRELSMGVPLPIAEIARCPPPADARVIQGHFLLCR